MWTLIPYFSSFGIIYSCLWFITDNTHWLGDKTLYILVKLFEVTFIIRRSVIFPIIYLCEWTKSYHILALSENRVSNVCVKCEGYYAAVLPFCV